MNSRALLRLAWIAKSDAFFAAWLVAVQAIPNDRAKKTKHVPNHSSDYNQRNRSHRIKWFDEVNRFDHVRPENEIDDRLRPADSDKKSDQTKCQPPINAPITRPSLWGLATVIPCIITRVCLRACVMISGRGTRSVIDQRRV